MGAYATLAAVKVDLNITDTADDTILNQLITDANDEMDNVLKPLVDTVPLTGAGITDSVKAAANYLVCSLWSGYIKDADRVKFWKERHDMAINRIAMQQSATPGDRQEVVVVESDYLSSELEGD